MEKIKKIPYEQNRISRYTGEYWNYWVLRVLRLLSWVLSLLPHWMVGQHSPGSWTRLQPGLNFGSWQMTPLQLSLRVLERAGLEVLDDAEILQSYFGQHSPAWGMAWLSLLGGAPQATGVQATKPCSVHSQLAQAGLSSSSSASHSLSKSHVKRMSQITEYEDLFRKNAELLFYLWRDASPANTVARTELGFRNYCRFRHIHCRQTDDIQKFVCVEGRICVRLITNLLRNFAKIRMK